MKNQKAEEIEETMKLEEENNFPNGDLWNNLADRLDELQRVPTTFEILSAILNSPQDFEK